MSNSRSMKLTFEYPYKIKFFEGITPIYFLKRLSEKYGNGSKIYIKRDDYTGIEISGNKIRKLEFLIGDAVKKGYNTILTYGGIQSNHCRATAAVCARFGLKCRLILRSYTPEKPFDGNLLLDKLFGAEIDFIPKEQFLLNQEKIINEIIKDEESKGNKVYYFPVGGSVPIGCWGYVGCFEEIIAQSKEMDINFNHIFCALGSGGTQGGLVLGRELFSRKEINIHGINVCDSVDYFKAEITKLLNDTKKMFNLDIDVSKIPLDIHGNYIGEGYAIAYKEELDIINEAAKLEGFILDPVYTGKAFYGMLDQIKNGKIKRGENILFIHTGGIFGIFPQKDVF